MGSVDDEINSGVVTAHAHLHTCNLRMQLREARAALVRATRRRDIT